MCDVTRILGKIEAGDPAAAKDLMPLVYDELRKLAAERMAQEKPGQTLRATALVHDAYIRLVDVDKAQHWDSRGHFFAAAAEAMRRILVEHARAKGRHKRGGGMERVDLDSQCAITESSQFDLLAVDEVVVGCAELADDALCHPTDEGERGHTRTRGIVSLTGDVGVPSSPVRRWTRGY